MVHPQTIINKFYHYLYFPHTVFQTAKTHICLRSLCGCKIVLWYTEKEGILQEEQTEGVHGEPL